MATKFAKRTDQPKPNRLTTQEADAAPGSGETSGEAIRVEVEERVREDGKRVRVTRTIRTRLVPVVVNSRVEERKKWAPFGGDTAGITTTGDEVQIVLVKKSKEKEDLKERRPTGVSCRYCGAVGSHWTLQCPLKEDFLKVLAAEEALGTSKSVAYVPPCRRAGAEAYPEERAIKISNLPEDINEQDLRAIFSRFGDVSRVNIPHERDSDKLRGYAFVNFYNQKDAVIAMKELQGLRLRHMILTLEWARPSIR